jgi:hypothetical protein
MGLEHGAAPIWQYAVGSSSMQTENGRSSSLTAHRPQLAILTLTLTPKLKPICGYPCV